MFLPKPVYGIGEITRLLNALEETRSADRHGQRAGSGTGNARASFPEGEISPRMGQKRGMKVTIERWGFGIVWEFFLLLETYAPLLQSKAVRKCLKKMPLTRPAVTRPASHQRNNGGS